MNRHSLLTIAALLLAACCGCEKFLDDQPTDRVTPDKAYSTTTELYLNALGPVYSRLGGYEESEGIQGSGRDICDFNTLCTDEAIIPTRGTDWYDGGFWQALYLHDFNGIDGT